MELVQQREKGKKGGKRANSEHEGKKREVGKCAENGSEVHLKK